MFLIVKYLVLFNDRGTTDKCLIARKSIVITDFQPNKRIKYNKRNDSRRIRFSLLKLYFCPIFIETENNVKLLKHL